MNSYPQAVVYSLTESWSFPQSLLGFSNISVRIVSVEWENIF